MSEWCERVSSPVLTSGFLVVLDHRASPGAAEEEGKEDDEEGKDEKAEGEGEE